VYKNEQCNWPNAALGDKTQLDFGGPIDRGENQFSDFTGSSKIFSQANIYELL